MDKILGKYGEQTYALLRIVSGLLFSMHGMQKMFGWLGGMGGSGEPAQLASLMGLAGIIELAGGLLIMVGFFTGCAAFLSSGLMAVAYFMAHFPNAFWPIQNQGELASIYAFLFLFVATKGSGIWSLDKAFKKG
jgi:putative oxidoreductase